MIIERPSHLRGHADHGWLKSWHSFSFADYRDPAWMGFGALRVLNEDRIAPGTGFGLHGHRDMEIVSWVLDGELSHQDCMGHSTVIRPGELQRMSAGTGVRHSEFNHAQGRSTHFLQIWLLPRAAGITPSYAQQAFDAAQRQGRLQLLADGRSAGAAADDAGPPPVISAPQGRPPEPTGPGPGPVLLHADAALWAARLDEGDAALTLALAADRCCWVQLTQGSVRANGRTLHAGDGLGLRDEAQLQLSHGVAAELLVMDLAR